MKIIEIIPQLSQGGAERFVVDLCNELSNKHQVILIVFHNLDELGFLKDEINDNVTVITMNKRKGMDFLLFFRLWRIISKLDPDVVHTHLRGIVYSLFSYIFPSTIRFIHTIHNDAEKETGGYIGKYVRIFAFKTKRVLPITISEESQRSFTNYYNLDSVLIYNGRPPYNSMNPYVKLQIEAELNDIKKDKETVILINVARMSPQKNQVELAKSINRLNECGYNIELSIIGRKDNEVVSEIENLQSSHIHLLGTRNNPRDYMFLADAFCLSSIYEGMPITLIECFSVGAIPICTPVGGIVNMIEDGVNGLLSSGSSCKDLEDVITRFLNLSDNKKREMKLKSKSTFAKFDMKICAFYYEKIMLS